MESSMDPQAGRRLTLATTVGDLLTATSRACPGEALVFPGERLSYPQFEARAEEIARGLMAMGTGLRDKVGVLLPNGPDHLIVLLGIVKAGAVAVPVNMRFKERELRHVVQASDMKALMCWASSDADDQAPLIQRALGDTGALGRGETLDGLPELRAIVSFGPDAPAGFTPRTRFLDRAAGIAPDDLDRRALSVRLRDPALMMFTSGTTSMPKAAILSHEAVTRQGYNLADVSFRLGAGDRVWNALPFFHIGGALFSIACIARGATHVHPGHFTPETAWAQLSGEAITVALPTFETMWLAITALPGFAPEKIPGLRLMMNIALPERLRQLQADFPRAAIISAFGSTEGCSFLTASRPDDSVADRAATLGLPMPGTEVRIAALDGGGAVAPGITGEILYRGPTMFDGYYKEPALNAEVIDAEGWFHSGDLGALDAGGRLSYHGRLKDMLKVGGENVSALEVEDYLAQHPAILIAQIVGAPDAYYGEVPAAYVQLKPGAALTQAELVDFCLDRIATFKIPRYLRVVSEWPMSGTKIRKVDLRAEIARELKDAGIEAAPKIMSARRA